MPHETQPGRQRPRIGQQRRGQILLEEVVQRPSQPITSLNMRRKQMTGALVVIKHRLTGAKDEVDLLQLLCREVIQRMLVESGVSRLADFIEGINCQLRQRAFQVQIKSFPCSISWGGRGDGAATCTCRLAYGRKPFFFSHQKGGEMAQVSPYVA